MTSLQAFFGLPLGLTPSSSTVHAVHNPRIFTQSFSSFLKICQ